MQLFFHAIVNENFTIEHLDRWLTGLEDIRSLLCVATYWRFPGLPLVALTACPTRVQKPRLWDSPPKNGRGNNITSGLSPHDPGQEVNRIVNAVASGGSILPITPPETNASWTMTIKLPKLTCNLFSADLRQKAENNLFTVLKNVMMPA
ncbi:hypothetical protein CERZMDRAFT_95435 [Cercospora zeae-maydis SCOH1-5]|uniref:Uncharacterized protein n=1 Tax=Cercospora zeae-maydis SCOH1-5 TaxID=717836 RepID=A0A6A6FP22_9PEZI|nr:hypothetical protein CERZMDRAFT_95435 [Cercospora zeae-maydis SCOH1-5]